MEALGRLGGCAPVRQSACAEGQQAMQRASGHELQEPASYATAL